MQELRKPLQRQTKRLVLLSEPHTSELFGAVNYICAKTILPPSMVGKSIIIYAAITAASSFLTASNYVSDWLDMMNSCCSMICCSYAFQLISRHNVLLWLQVPTLSMRDVILALDYPDFYLHDVEGLKIILSAYHNAVNAVRSKV